MGNVARKFDQAMTLQKNKQMPIAKGQRTGLLGGSFNPAHDGHLHISNLALEHLNLDSVWWMISPQNPLKSVNGMASLDQRMEKACEVAANSNIIVTDIECELGTQYTSDTLPALKRTFPGGHFVWLMGADNLAQIEQWYQWEKIFMTLPVAIFARPTYPNNAENAEPVKRFASFQVIEANASTLADMKPPAWIFLKTALNPKSATEIRARTNGNWASK
jgi:nicotinate-nucleotide adenylyltransferase